MAGSEGLAIIDTIAVERAVRGQRAGARLTDDEARYAAGLLFEAGYGWSVVAPMVGVGAATIAAWFPAKVGTVRSQPVVCGTTRGYRAHLRRGESCEKCRRANSAADYAYRRNGAYASGSGAAA
ncbi:hypothetical protein [Streptomyces sp. NPDC048659]|uniref:hypothetical protein n=1 Tax=Streptomyces sp. NPDC048659 TaxID=3155489 RepID=UPI00342978FB